jgi:hypothetical protein
VVAVAESRTNADRMKDLIRSAIHEVLDEREEKAASEAKKNSKEGEEDTKTPKSSGGGFLDGIFG